MDRTRLVSSHLKKTSHAVREDVEPRDGASYKYRPRVSNESVYACEALLDDRKLIPLWGIASPIHFLLGSPQVVSACSNENVHSLTGEHGKSK